MVAILDFARLLKQAIFFVTLVFYVFSNYLTKHSSEVFEELYTQSNHYN